MTAAAPVRAGWAAAAVVDHPSGFLALSNRNLRFEVDGLSGFVAYREQGRHFVSMGGLHAKPYDRAALLDAFLAFAEAHRRSVAAVQLRADQVKLFGSRGFAVNQFGSSYGLALAGYSLAGRKRMKLRHKIKQAREAGLRVVEIGDVLPRTEATFARLRAVSDAWLRAKRKKELDFMIGEIGGPTDIARRIFAAENSSGELVGFITYVPVWGTRPGWLHDLTRRVPDAPAGTMEAINAEALARFSAEGAANLHFGFTPFVVDEEEPEGGNRLLARAVRLLGRYGSAIYPARSQVDYKLKWGPDVVEREYLALRPPSPRAILDLLLLTRSI